MISYVSLDRFLSMVSRLTRSHCTYDPSDITLTNIANALGVISVMLIIVYQFVDVIEKRQNLAGLDASKSQ